MLGFNGGLIGQDRTTSLSAAVGVWTPGEQIKARRTNIWPSRDLWTPANITTALWLDAGDFSTLFTTAAGSTLTTNGQPVGRWVDKSGNNRNATTTTDSNRPVLTTTGLNSKNALNFNVSQLDFPTGFLNGTAAFTVAMVLRTPSQDNKGIFGPNGPGGVNGVGLELINFTSTPLARLRINGNVRSFTGLWNTNDTPSITTIVASSSSTAGFANGSSAGTAQPGNSALNHNGLYTIGAYDRPLLSCATMHMSEFIIVASDVTELNRQKLEGYLAHKWGLTANLPNDHPYKTVGPTP
jgi:hypothetical protein